MFKLKTEQITFEDGESFTVSEPKAIDIIEMNDKGSAAAIFLVGRCVSYNGETLGDNAGALPARYLNKLSEAVTRLGGLDEGNG
jgi:hypothetical protein